MASLKQYTAGRAAKWDGQVQRVEFFVVIKPSVGIEWDNTGFGALLPTLSASWQHEEAGEHRPELFVGEAHRTTAKRR